MRIGSLTALAMTGAFVYVSDLDPQFVRFGLAFPLVHAIWGLALFVCVMAGLYAANKKLLWTAAVSGFIGFGVVLFHPFPIE